MGQKRRYDFLLQSHSFVYQLDNAAPPWAPTSVECSVEHGVNMNLAVASSLTRSCTPSLRGIFSADACGKLTHLLLFAFCGSDSSTSGIRLSCITLISCVTQSHSVLCAYESERQDSYRFIFYTAFVDKACLA